jgi:hypothetical protein
MTHSSSIASPFAFLHTGGTASRIDSIIDNLMLQTLHAQIEVSRLHLASLSCQMDTARTEKERSHLVALYEDAMQLSESMQLELAARKPRQA